MSLSLNVFREVFGDYQLVGTLEAGGEGVVFSYAQDYLSAKAAKSISLSLPLQKQAFTKRQTRAFFEGLLPEGNMLGLYAGFSRDSENSYAEILTILHDESVGALVFGKERSDLLGGRGYRVFDPDRMQMFSEQPYQVAFDTGMSSRLSIAGAQTKIGLYHRGENPYQEWYLPQGSAPSTHIIKASSGAFPLQTVNEAFCLSVARHCGFDVASFFLIPSRTAEPLLAVKRFDREVPNEPLIIDGLEVPIRLHQEDACQAAGLPVFFKYEPTEGHYASLVANIINKTAFNPFGDRLMFFNELLFDFLIGNCDNHLKNYSLLWRPDWSSCELSPLYDITCTTFYPSLSHEMGVSLCDSRIIEDVAKDDILQIGRSVGISEKIALQQYRDLCDQLPAALDAAEKELVEQGFSEVTGIAAFIREDSMSRLSL